MKTYGKPRQILTDRGIEFYPTKGETSAFTEFCSGNGIKHIVASVRRPSTIGKIEAFHKAYENEAWMFDSHRGFIRYWNYERPHQGIGYLYPADVYFRDRCGGIVQVRFFGPKFNSRVVRRCGIMGFGCLP